MELFTKWAQDKEFTAILFIAIGGIVLYFVGDKLIRIFMKGFIQKQYRKQPKKDIEKRQKTLISLTTSIWQIAIIAIAGLSIFKILFPTVDLSPLLTSAGIVGIAIAFGAQSLVKDFLSGLFIISENQYRVGDVIQIQGTSVSDAHGKVERIGTRTTVIRDKEGNVHYIPNGSIVHVINKTMGYSRVNFTVSIASTSDLDKAIEIVNKTGQSLLDDKKWHSKILEAPRFDSIDSFTANTVEISIIGKVQPSDQWSVTAEMRRRLLRDLKKGDIALA